ncbi:hypothetical protein ACEQ8H_006083 [Pleosporales sp. CAS-2024a]
MTLPSSHESPESTAHVLDPDSLTGQDSHIPSHHLSSQKRRSSKTTKVPGELRRSTSTPHMRDLPLVAAGELSPTSNKPRNKLGYHRTSVACGHCRRRKIRCLLAHDDPQGRCSNCIRLKKDCNFYPVDHNPDAPPSQILGSKDTSPVPPLTPAASSPRHPHPGDKTIADFRAPYPILSSAIPNPNYNFQAESEIDIHHGLKSSHMPAQQPAFSYPHPIDTQWPPVPAFLPSSTVAESPQSSTSYWRQSPSTAPSAYGSESNVSGGRTPAAMSTSSTMSYGHSDSHPWGQQPPFQPPTRSMSYGNIEGLTQLYAGQGLDIQQHDFPRRNSPYSFPTSIDTNHATILAATIGGSTPAPLSAPVVPNQYYPATWNTYEGVQVPGRSMSMQWYPDSNHLDRVQEEGAPPVGYNQLELQQYYSGA